MAYSTPTSYNGSMGNSVRTISPSSNVQNSSTNYTTPKIYRGFSSNNPNARNGVLYDVDLIKQDIHNHFMTAKGERVMLPDFGSVIWNYIYDPLDDQTKEAIKLDAEDIISQDPRVVLESVDVNSFEHGIIVDLKLMILLQNVSEQMAIEFNINTQPSSGGGGGGSAGGGGSGGGSGGGGGY